jgi:glutathione synthase/RimK-type ligase-like ATP-grasp enzyme
MKIAIHNRPGSFSDRWLEYCKKNYIAFKMVNCYESDIISQLSDCDILLWHHHHENYKDALFAQKLLFSLEQSGKKVFPDFNTAWHFDDKIGQKYLLESIDAPLVPTYIFYEKRTALNWIKLTSFPKVFKLRGGAGSSNVKLVKSRDDAKKLIRKAFGKGFLQKSPWVSLKERFRRVKEGKAGLRILLNGLVRFIIVPEFNRMYSREKGYIYFQDYFANNEYDIRVIVIGEKAFAIKRMTRKNDFRASGSGEISYDRREIDIRCIALAFSINNRIKSQCIAYDFVFDAKDQPYILEISYGFTQNGYESCPGYWDCQLNWYEGPFNPQEWMIQNLIDSISE